MFVKNKRFGVKYSYLCKNMKGMKFKYEDFLIAGKSVETKLMQDFSRFLGTSKMEDIGGVDLKLSLTFDVKKARKIRRRDLDVSYDKTWIEFKNVKGDLGSICKKHLDFFILENIDCWLVKSREDAFTLFTEMSKNEGAYKQLETLDNNVSEVKLYQPYQRYGRKDVIMLVEIDNPLWPTKMILPKSNLNQ